jgi:hypothetical protein
MKKIISLFALLSSTYLFAQNYQGVYFNKAAHYKCIQSLYQNNPLYTINMDSSSQQGVITEWFNNDFFYDSLPHQLLFQNSHSSLFGKKYLLNNNGSEIIINTYNDTLYINNSTSAGTSWMLYHYSTGDYIEATITNHQPESFLGITDSVKTISLQAKNSLNLPINNNWNGKTLKLSKHYGWVNAPGFLYFPDDTSNYVIQGISQPISGIQNLTAADIFNIDVGDEFHYHGYYSVSIPAHTESWTILKVINKFYPLGSDSVYFEMERCQKIDDWNFGSQTIITYHDTINKSYDISSDAHLSAYTLQPYFFNNTFPEAGYVEFTNDTTLHSRRKKISHDYLFYQPFCNCYSPVIGTGVSQDITYADGLGYTDYVDMTCFGGCYENLVYFKKNNESWGAPLSCDSLLGYDALEYNPSIHIHPNPSNGVFYITANSFPSGSLNIKITDTTGKNCLSLSNIELNDQKIDLSGFSDGIYFVSLFNITHSWHQKLLLKK